MCVSAKLFSLMRRDIDDSLTILSDRSGNPVAARNAGKVSLQQMLHTVKHHSQFMASLHSSTNTNADIGTDTNTGSGIGIGVDMDVDPATPRHDAPSTGEGGEDGEARQPPTFLRGHVRPRGWLVLERRAYESLLTLLALTSSFGGKNLLRRKSAVSRDTVRDVT